MQVNLMERAGMAIPSNARGPFTIVLPGGESLVVQTREELESLRIEIDDNVTGVKMSVTYESP